MSNNLPSKPKELREGPKPVLIGEGDTRILIKGSPPAVPIRILSESYYQSLLEYIERLEKVITSR